jgi:membrane protease YdiL (CAAX protease family)
VSDAYSGSPPTRGPAGPPLRATRGPDGPPPDPSPDSVVAPPAPLDAVPLRQRRLIAVAEIFLCSSLPTQILLQTLLVQAGWAPLSETGGLSLPFVVAISLADTALLIVLMVVLTRAHGESVSELWLGRRRAGGEIGLGLLLVPVVFLLVVVLLNVLRLAAPGLHNVPTNPLEEMARGGMADAAALGLVAVFAGGVREELQRAFLLRRFEKHLGGAAVGVIVLSVAFGLGHALQGWDAAIATGALGAFWAVVYLWRRSTLAPLVSHAGFNSLEVLRVAMGAM